MPCTMMKRWNADSKEIVTSQPIKLRKGGGEGVDEGKDTGNAVHAVVPHPTPPHPTLPLQKINSDNIDCASLKHFKSFQTISNWKLTILDKQKLWKWLGQK